jgi:predicted RNA-binding protein with PUA-like domain
LSKNYWLMKTEPETFGFDDLVGRPERTDRWEGVRNYQARNMMRDQFQLGDEVFIYHSRIAEPAIVGVARVVRTAYPDPTALDPKSKYFDPKSAEQGASRWVMVDVQASGRFVRPITLQELRSIKGLEELPLLRPGQRLSIQPVEAQHWQLILGLSRLELLPESASSPILAAEVTL